MAAWTDAQLRLAVAKELGVLAQNASAMKAEWDLELTEKSLQVRATLQRLELCYWAAGAIPDEVKLGLTYLVAEAAKDYWRRSGYDKGALGMTLIQEMNAAAPRREPTRSQSF